MYKKLVAFLFLIIPFLSQSQDINKLDSEGKRHGYWEKRYESGRVRYSGQFEHGKEVGEFLFYENKIINNYPAIRKIFDNNIDKSTVIFYDIYGKIKSEGTMLGRNKVGTWKYYDQKKKIILTENYQNNMLDGKRIVYYDVNKIAESSEYKEGKLNGVNSRFSKKGVKLHEMTYENGLLHGRSKFFEINGNIKESGLYYKDYKVGKWDFYIDGNYVGFKVPNKKRSHPSDEDILANIDNKEEKKREYSKVSNETILANIERKKEKDYSYEKLSDEEILNNINKKSEEGKESAYEKLSDEDILKNINRKSEEEIEYSKISDDEILKNISSKMEAKIKEIERLEDEEILKNINKKKELEKKRLDKLSDAEILENIKGKQAKSNEEVKAKKLTDDEILANIKGKQAKANVEVKAKKLTDKEILDNIRNKQSQEPAKKVEVKKLTSEEILENIKGKQSTKKEK